MAYRFRYRAVVEYDGSDFYGFQVQATERTVQGEIEAALAKVTQQSVRIAGSGRTDAGVHATGQVIAFNVDWKHSLDDLHRALNATLPRDIAITRLELVSDPSFHPRFSAICRTYKYRIIEQPWPSAIQRKYVHHVKHNLDVEAMQRAATHLIGEHDFASFGKPPQGNNSVREIFEAKWTIDNKRLMFTITANAFLYRMVRNIVGTLLKVGTHKISPEDFRDILVAKELSRCAPPAPAQGLYLVNVAYPK